MNMELVPVKASKKEILRNLLEKYDYEFSQYDQKDVNDLGLYGYDYLDHYWTEEGRHAFFIRVDGRLAGFVMINTFPEVEEPTDYTLAEFFVMYKYRGAVGRLLRSRSSTGSPGSGSSRGTLKTRALCTSGTRSSLSTLEGTSSICQATPKPCMMMGLLAMCSFLLLQTKHRRRKGRWRWLKYVSPLVIRFCSLFCSWEFPRSQARSPASFLTEQLTQMGSLRG